jgi:serine protease Do
MQIENGMRVRRLRSILAATIWGAGMSAAVLIGTARSAEAFSASDIYKNASNSVVLIFGFGNSGAGSSGTGSVLTQDGLVLTNNHVIAGGDGHKLFSNIVVYFKPNPISGDNNRDLTTPYKVTVVARDVELDLALLRVDNPPNSLRPIEVGNSEEVDIGESVAAIGHPGGGGLWTLTTGTVSSKRRDAKREIFQTDTAINPGNSGGPLIDEYSRLVGINTFVRRVNNQGVPLEGLNYSLRSSLALEWVNRQGVARVSAVARSSAVAEPAPVPLRAEPAPSRARARLEPPRPEPPLESASELYRAAPPPPEREAREFSAPDGTEMYGVPNPDNDLHESLQQARKDYSALLKRAGEAFEDLKDGGKFDDAYDNF